MTSFVCKSLSEFMYTLTEKGKKYHVTITVFVDVSSVSSDM